MTVCVCVCVCVRAQQVQGGGASEPHQVNADVFEDASGVPPSELRPPSGHSQSHQHNFNDYSSNTPAIFTKITNSTVMNTADTQLLLHHQSRDSNTC